MQNYNIQWDNIKEKFQLNIILKYFGIHKEILQALYVMWECSLGFVATIL